MRRFVKVYFDGGCRPEPVGMETAVVVRGQAHVRRALGPGTSLDAEWLALLHAVEVARELGLVQPLFLGDALAVIGHANKLAPGNAASARHLLALQERWTSPVPLHLRHVKRSQNLAGIALARFHPR